MGKVTRSNKRKSFVQRRCKREEGRESGEKQNILRMTKPGYYLRFNHVIVISLHSEVGDSNCGINTRQKNKIKS